MDQTERKNNKVMIIGALLIAMVFAYTLFKSEFKKDNSESAKTSEGTEINYPKIAPEDLKNRLKNPDKIQVVDVRGSDDYKLEHLIGSVNITSEESFDGIPQGKTIVIIGYEEQKGDLKKAVDLAKSKGFDDAYVLDGGIPAWKGIGGSTISIGNPSSFTDNAKVIYISPEDLKKIIDDQNYPKYILDVSSKQAFDNEHLPGAENIFLDDLEKSADKIPLEKTVVVYGENDLQSFQAGVRLSDLGIMSAKVLEGGLPAWKEKGFETVK
jgi:rhodanese-related sulfurtransferase